MKTLSDLTDVLAIAFQRNLIDNFYVQSCFIDIDFSQRDEATMCKIEQLRDYIYANYPKIHAIDYMPIIHRLRLYVCDWPQK
jgi:hypothetical protein